MQSYNKKAKQQNKQLHFLMHMLIYHNFKQKKRTIYDKYKRIIYLCTRKIKQKVRQTN